MKISTVYKMAVAGLALAVLSGCANTRAIQSSELDTDYGYAVAQENVLTDNLSVEVEGFKGTSKFGFSGRTMPALDNNEATKALIQVLDSSEFYNSNGEYKLLATLVDDHTGMFTTSRSNIINYKLVNTISNETVFNEDVKGEGETTVNNHFFGNTYETAHRSGSAALEDNFKKLVNLLSLQ